MAVIKVSLSNDGLTGYPHDIDLVARNLTRALGLFCGSFLRKGEVSVYVGSIENLKARKAPRNAARTFAAGVSNISACTTEALWGGGGLMIGPRGGGGV